MLGLAFEEGAKWHADSLKKQACNEARQSWRYDYTWFGQDFHQLCRLRDAAAISAIRLSHWPQTVFAESEVACVTQFTDELPVQ